MESECAQKYFVSGILLNVSRKITRFLGLNSTSSEYVVSVARNNSWSICRVWNMNVHRSNCIRVRTFVIATRIFSWLCESCYTSFKYIASVWYNSHSACNRRLAKLKNFRAQVYSVLGLSCIKAENSRSVPNLIRTHPRT